MKYIEKRETKPLECGSQVRVHLLPPDLEGRAPGDPDLSKSAIWVEEGDFYRGVVRSPEKEVSAKVPGIGEAGSAVAGGERPKRNTEDRRAARKALLAKLDDDQDEQLAAHIILGFDTEYKSPPRQSPQEIRDGKHSGGVKNAVLSYQFYAVSNAGPTWSGLCCPDTSKQEDRMKFGEFIRARSRVHARRLAHAYSGLGTNQDLWSAG